MTWLSFAATLHGLSPIGDVTERVCSLTLSYFTIVVFGAYLFGLATSGVCYIVELKMV